MRVRRGGRRGRPRGYHCYSATPLGAAYTSASSGRARSRPPADQSAAAALAAPATEAPHRAALLFLLVSANPFATCLMGLPPLRRWDRRAAAAHGLAPQDVNTGGDNDRGAD